MTCEDCGDESKRRTRCLHCGKLVCSWCFNHVYGMQQTPDDREKRKKENASHRPN